MPVREERLLARVSASEPGPGRFEPHLINAWHAACDAADVQGIGIALNRWLHTKAHSHLVPWRNPANQHSYPGPISPWTWWLRWSREGCGAAVHRGGVRTVAM